MEYVVDVQGFKSSLNTFIFKEVAIIALQEDAVPVVYNFRPPYSWERLLHSQKSSNRWLEQNYHGIPWGSGDIPYSQVQETLRNSLKDARKIYVKGLEKKTWLQEILPDMFIQNIEDLSCPSLKKLPKDFTILCTHHVLCWNASCAARNTYMMRTWLLDDGGRRPILDQTNAGNDELDYPIEVARQYKREFEKEIWRSMYT